MVMEVSGDHKLVQFYVGLLNYCTGTEESLAKFAFNMFDGNNSGGIEQAESTAVQDVHGQEEEL